MSNIFYILKILKFDFMADLDKKKKKNWKTDINTDLNSKDVQNICNR